AASFAAHLALADLFPSQRTAFAKLMSDLGYDPDAPGPAGSPGATGVAPARPGSPGAPGSRAPGGVLPSRHGDESNQLGDLGPEPRGMTAAYEDWTGYRPGTSRLLRGSPQQRDTQRSSPV